MVPLILAILILLVLLIALAIAPVWIMAAQGAVSGGAAAFGGAVASGAAKDAEADASIARAQSAYAVLKDVDQKRVRDRAAAYLQAKGVEAPDAAAAARAFFEDPPEEVPAALKALASWKAIGERGASKARARGLAGLVVKHLGRVGARDRILEVGGAPGDVALEVAKRLKISRKRMVVADVRACDEPRVPCVQNEPDKLPLKDGEFGAAYMLMVAHHFSHPREMFDEIARVLKPGARLVLKEHAFADAASTALYDFAHVIGDMNIYSLEGQVTKYRTPEAWTALIEPAGFKLISASRPAGRLDGIFITFERV